MSSSKALLILLILLPLLAAPAANAAVLISVDASPLSIPADGKSYCQILVTVLDQGGSSVTDGTEVRLTTSAGDVTPSTRTSGGRAIGILTSSASPQIAAVTATVDGASASTQVEFSSSAAAEVTAGTKTIRMTGGSLAYSVDQDTVIGSNGVTIQYRGLTIQASSAQVCQRIGEIRAQGEVNVKKDAQTLTADALVLDIRGDRLRLRNLDDESSARTFNAGSLEPATLNARTDAQTFAPLVSVTGRTWIVSPRLTLIPGQKILFFKASIYVGDAKVITMPYYSYSYETRESILQQVRYTSNEGMVMDLPFYYHIADSGTGAVKLRYAANGTNTGTYSRPPKGASLGLEEEYSLGENNHGRVFIDSVAGPNQAYELAHHFEFGPLAYGGRGDITARYQGSSGYARDIYDTSINMFGSLRQYSYMLSAYSGGSRFQQTNASHPETPDYMNQSTTSVKTVLRPKMPIMSKPLGALTPSLTLGYGTLWSASGYDPSSHLYQSLGLSFNRSQSGVGKIGTSLDGTMSFTATTEGETGSGLRLRPGLRYGWNGGSASLSYTLNLQQGTTDSISSLSKHQLGCMLFLNRGDKWGSMASADYGLDSQRLNLYSTFYYRVAKRLQIRSNYSLYRYAFEVKGVRKTYQTSYFMVGIYHPLGPYEIGLAWSPDGQNYGMDRDRRIWLELGGSGF